MTRPLSKIAFSLSLLLLLAGKLLAYPGLVNHDHSASGKGGFLGNTQATSLVITSSNPVRYSGVSNFRGPYGYVKPDMVYIGANTITPSTNTATGACVQFPDGAVRCSQAASTMVDTATASWVAGTDRSGLSTGTVVTANTWYPSYFVKSRVSNSFVTVGTTITCIPANYTALNVIFGTNSWVHAVDLRVGDGSASNTISIVPFLQQGFQVVYTNAITGADTADGNPATGIMFIHQGAAGTTATWTYAVGVSSLTVPGNIKIGNIMGLRSSPSAIHDFEIYNAAGTIAYYVETATNDIKHILVSDVPLTGGVLLNSGVTSVGFDIDLTGYIMRE